MNFFIYVIMLLSALSSQVHASNDAFFDLSSLNYFIEEPNDPIIKSASDAIDVKLNQSASNPNDISISFDFDPGYKLYRDSVKLSSDTLSFSTYSWSLDAQSETTEDGREAYIDPVGVHLTAYAEYSGQHQFVLSYQGCYQTTLCYQPQKVNFTLEFNKHQPPKESINPSSGTEGGKVGNAFTELLNDTSIIIILLTFAGAGFLVSMTPCVLPMLPILSNVLLRNSENMSRLHAFRLSVAYVLSSALVYALLGVIAGVSGESLHSALQSTLFKSIFASLFIVLALSMWGLFTLSVPSFLMNTLSSASGRVSGQGMKGAVASGCLSAFIAGPCMAAPLAGALLFIAGEGSPALGGLALFAFGIGMGLPLVALSVFAGHILPKAGAWMEEVKRFFGFLLVAMALWVSMPLLSLWLQILSIVALLIAFLVWLKSLKMKATMVRIVRDTLLYIGSAYAVALSVVLFTLPDHADHLNWKRPLSTLVDQIHSGQSDTTLTHDSFQWQYANTLNELDDLIGKNEDVVNVVYYTADWCSICSDLERNLWSSETLRSMHDVQFIKVDVSDHSEESRLLKQKFNILGPPAILKVVNGNVEISHYGDIGKIEFLELLNFN